MRTPIIAAIAAAAGLATAAQAAIVTYDTSIPLQSTNFINVPGTLPQWDPALFPGQTLIGVTIRVTGTAQGTVKFENVDPSAATITYALSASLSLAGPAALSVSVNPTSGFQGFGATGFDGTNDFGGTSGFTFNSTVSDSDSESVAPMNFGAYVGAGTFAFTVTGIGTSFASGGGNLDANFNTDAGARIFVDYEFIPTPGAAALLGLGGLAAARRRRA